MSSTDPTPTVINGHTFTVDSRYILKDSRILGKGSFGVVCTAYDSIRRIELAIKRIRPYANDEWDAKHTLREIRLLKLLGPHPNIVSLYELSLFEAKTELYMMMELMDCDLHRVIQSKQPLSEKHHKCFVKQILEAVKAMHAIGVFHRDLKPGNILVNKDCQVRITDFGLARFMDETTRSGQNDVNPMTEYVVTRWYRCPELLLSPNRPYSEAVDLWSVGCILAELLRRKPLFPGKSHANQVQLIFEVIGYNTGDDLGFPVTGEALAFLEKRCRYKKQSFRKYMPDASEEALELVEILLTVDPKRRPSANMSLKHRFLQDAELLHDYNKTYLKRPTIDYFDFENEKYSVEQLRSMIDDEVFSAAANAYRFNRKTATNDVSPNERDVTESPPQRLYSSHSVRNLPTDGDGPASQMPTQVRNNRTLDRADPNNPFGRSNSNVSQAVRRDSHSQKEVPLSVAYENANSSNPAVAADEARQQLAQVLQRNDTEVNAADPRGPPAANILATVRNEVGPANTRGRKSVPKTPSPKRMDIIMQKDLANKQRFQQQSLQSTDTDQVSKNANASNQSSANASARAYRSTFPHPPADSAATTFQAHQRKVTGENPYRTMSNAPIGVADHHQDNAHTGGQAQKAPSGRFMNVPFPSLSKLPFGSKSSSAVPTSNAVAAKKINSVLMGGNRSYSTGGLPEYNDNSAINRSAAMMHSGANVIYQQNDHGAHY